MLVQVMLHVAVRCTAEPAFISHLSGHPPGIQRPTYPSEQEQCTEKKRAPAREQATPSSARGGTRPIHGHGNEEQRRGAIAALAWTSTAVIYVYVHRACGRIVTHERLRSRNSRHLQCCPFWCLRGIPAARHYPRGTGGGFGGSWSGCGNLRTRFSYKLVA
jgi:hypothetical protein